MDIYQAISNAAFFKELGEDSRKRLSESARYRSFKKREVLFLEGEEGHSIYLLLDGSVQLAKASPDGSERVIKIVQPGESFAEVILFEQPSFPVTATALIDSMLLLLPKAAFHQMLTEEGFRNDFIAGLLRRQRFLTERIFQLTSLDVEERFFQFIREHHGDSKTVSFNITKRDIAAAIGVSPETLSRLVQKLEGEGRLVWRGKQIELK